jgi:hypothetical protein
MGFFALMLEKYAKLITEAPPSKKKLKNLTIFQTGGWLS